MMGKTHMLGGVAFGLAAISIMGVHGIGGISVGMACATMGSLMPDIDHPNAKISRMNLFCSAISHWVCSLTKHRHFCHTLPFMALIGIFWMGLLKVFGYFVGPHLSKALITLTHNTGIPIFKSILTIDIASYITLGCIFLLVGMLSHLVLDTCNPEGIMWLYPYKRRFRILPIKTGSPGELIFCMGLLALILLWLLFWADGLEVLKEIM